MYILGISAYYHDSAACLLKDGVTVFAAQEERFTRIKHDESFPTFAVQAAFEFEGISIDEVEHVVFYEKPFVKFDRIIDTYARRSPKGFWSFRRAMKSWLGKKIWIADELKKKLNFKGDVLFSDHHFSHAASAFFNSPFQEAAVLTIDGVGEKTTCAIYKGSGNSLEPIASQEFPHSIGLFYSAFTFYCGFKVNSGEYKLMGLAPYGEPNYVELIKKHFISFDETGLIRLNMKLFSYETGSKMLNSKAYRILGKPALKQGFNITQYYKDMAASVQVITEEVILLLANHAIEKTGSSNLCLSGGVALNCKANQLLQEKGVCDNLWIQPASGDAGGAIGAALAIWYEHLKKERVLHQDSPLQHVYLGTYFESGSIENYLNEIGINFEEYDDASVAKALSKKKVVGWFKGRMEFGPRALGNRSILASPTFEDMQSHLNQAIKKREGFRPFAPVCLEEKATEWFQDQSKNQYMLRTCNSERHQDIPSCVHKDGTARLQTLTKETNKELHGLLEKFNELTSCPVLINTSFNVRGEPIVQSPEDALRCFFQTDMELLVLENALLDKSKLESIPSQFLTQVKYELD